MGGVDTIGNLVMYMVISTQHITMAMVILAMD